MEVSRAGFSLNRNSAPAPACTAAITAASAPAAVCARSRSPVSTGPSSARIWEATSDGLLVIKGSAKCLGGAIPRADQSNNLAQNRKALSTLGVNSADSWQIAMITPAERDPKIAENDFVPS